MPGQSTSAGRGVWDAWRDNPQWRRLYLARTTSLFGNWLNTLAIVHLLGQGEQTSALALALVFVLKQLPTVILGPLAGVLADRLDRKRLMIVCDVLDATIALSFLVLATWGTGFIYLLAGLQIAVATVFEPARQASIPNLARREDLSAVNALSSVTWSIMFAVGTTVGGVVLATWGWEVAMVLDAASYAVSGILVASVRFPTSDEEAAPPPPGASTPAGRTFDWRRLSGFDDVIEGARYIVRDPMVRHLIAVKFTWGVMGAITLFLTLLGMRPDYSIAGSRDLSIASLWAARAVGTGIGPFIARAYAGEDERKLRQTIGAGFVLAIVCYAVLPLWLTPAVTIPLVIVAHIGGAMVWVMSSVLLQLNVPDAYRGRTFAAELGLVMLTNSAANVGYAAVVDAGWLTLEQTIWLATGVFTVAIARWVWVELRLSGSPD